MFGAIARRKSMGKQLIILALSITKLAVLATFFPQNKNRLFIFFTDS